MADSIEKVQVEQKVKISKVLRAQRVVEDLWKRHNYCIKCAIENAVCIR